MEFQTQIPKMPAEKQKELQKLRCWVQNYDWGMIGPDSKVAKLFHGNSGSGIDPIKPYAEFWMGTHDSGPSFLVQPTAKANGLSLPAQNVSLKDWIRTNPHALLGKKVAQKWGCDLPFLFKVLSVAKALSIQAHPDKELAKVLHKKHPDLYKDANHKPEMALALTEFKALCGFISLEELKEVLQNVPEIVELVSVVDINKILQLTLQEAEGQAKSLLQSVYTQLMSASEEMVTKALSNLKTRLLKECQVRQLTEKEQLVLQLEKQYPADVGVISAFFLNYVTLNPGEALYLGENEPHAYLKGDCIECMATSDNVVRAGLTPKHRDVQTLCSMLTYKQGYPEILHGESSGPYIKKYIPPFEEFEVDSCILPQGASVMFPAAPGPSLFLVTGGEATMHTASSTKHVIREGGVLFAPADTKVTVSAASELQLYRAGVNSKFLSTVIRQQCM